MSQLLIVGGKGPLSALSVCFIAIVFLALLVDAQSAPPPFVNVSKIVSPAECGTNSYFSVALVISRDGSTTAASCPYAGAYDTGLVFVYVRSSNGLWTFQAMLNATNKGPSAEEGFGLGIDGNGNTIATSVFGATESVINVYVRGNGGTWSLQAALTPQVPLPYYSFGKSISLSADGKTLASNTETYALFFTRSGSDWTQQGPGIAIGYTIEVITLSADGNTAALLDQNPDGITILTRSGGVWTSQGPVMRTNAASLDLALFAQNSQRLFATTGDAVVPFVRNNNNYNQVNDGTDPDPDYVEPLGVSANGETIIVGTDGSDSVQVFWTNNTNTLIYQKIQTLTRPENAAGPEPYFGHTAALSDSGNILAVGAESDDEGGAYSGAVFMFQRAPLAPACKPDNSIDRARCQARIEGCRTAGIRMKWTGKGCRRKNRAVGDGGCQCAGYCGYTCAGACRKDPECRWKQGKCIVKATNLPGVPITQCM